jgi:hypothetical protein
MSIQNQVIAIIEQVTNKKLTYTSRNLKDNKGVLMFFDDATCVDLVAKIETALTPFFASIGITPSMSNAINTFDVGLQSSTGDDDGAYLTVFYDFTKHYINSL